MQTNHSFSMPILSLWALSFLHVQAVDGWAAEAWRDPVPLYAVNTAYHEKAPFLSFDGRTLYFGRQDGQGGAYTRIYATTRAGPSSPFAIGREISALSVPGAHVSSPWVSADNLRMYYYTTEAGKRLFMAARSSTRAPWQPGLEISELNGMGDVVTPTLTEDERVIVFSGYDVPGGRGGYDLWMADRPDRNSPFTHVTNLETLNTGAWDVHPSMTPDGLTLYFTSNRSGRSQIFVAHRSSRDAPFGDVEHLGVLDTPNGGSEFPSITADGKALYFGHWPTGGNMDIYVSYPGRTYYVDATHGSDAGDGRSAAAAFATIQRGIDVALDGDEVLVGPGVYREEVRFQGRAITVRSMADAAIIEAPNGFGVFFFMGEGADTVLRNLIIRNSYIGILCIGSSPTITNMTIVGNVYGAEAYATVVGMGACASCISNSILWGNARSGPIGFDVTYSCVQRDAGGPGLGETVPLGAGNFSADPQFVDAEHGDYHVRSARGRYWPEHNLWVLDDVTSPCVDAGDPAADLFAERKPNGSRLNVGAHGGTAFAEMHETLFSGDVNGDGLFNDIDYELFMDLWEQQVQAESPTLPVRR